MLRKVKRGIAARSSGSRRCSRRAAQPSFFPEGRSHSEPRLFQMRTGAARVLLLSKKSPVVFPIGLWFTRKEEGPRSRRGGRRALWGADQERFLRRRRERGSAGTGILDPKGAARGARLIRLSPAALDEPPAVSVVAFYTFKALVVVVLGFPLAVLGVAAWYVPYHLCGLLANRVPGAARERDQIALYKLAAGVVLFPFTYALEVLFILRFLGPSWAAAGAAALPIAGILSLRYLEHAECPHRRVRPAGRRFPRRIG